MRLRQRDVEGLAGERDDAQSGRGPGRAVLHAVRQHQVVARGQGGEVLLRDVLVGQPQLGRIRKRRERGRERPEQRLADAVEGAQRHDAAGAVLEALHRAARRRHRLDDVRAGGGQHPSGLGERQGAPAAPRQRGGELALQRREVLRHRRRRHAQLLGHGGHAAEGAELAQDGELVKIHGTIVGVALTYRSVQKETVVLTVPGAAEAGPGSSSSTDPTRSADRPTW